MLGRLLLQLVAVAGLSACATQPAIYSQKASEQVLPSQWQVGFELSGDTTSLLSLVPGLPINSLLKDALTHNPGLKQTALLMEQAQWQVERQQGANLPNLELSTSGQRTKQVAGGTDYNSQIDVQLKSRWELDLWGKLADEVSRAEYSYQATADDLEYARRSLVANTIKTWLTWVSSREKLFIEQRRLAVQLQNQQIIEQRYRRGLGNLQDLDTAKSQWQQTRANAQALQQTVQENLRNLQQLAGSLSPLQQVPALWPEIVFPELKLPAQLIGQRPDLQAAFKRIQVADAASKVAYKSLLPSFTLDLSTSLTGASAHKALNGDPGWQLLGQLTQPLFQAGRLQANLALAELAAEQSYWAYQQTLLTAVLEVESSLDKEKSLSSQQSALEKAGQYAELSEQHLLARFRQGLASLLELHTAQQTSFNVRSQLLDIRLSRAINRINLGVAMGLPVEQG